MIKAPVGNQIVYEIINLVSGSTCLKRKTVQKFKIFIANMISMDAGGYNFSRKVSKVGLATGGI